MFRDEFIGKLQMVYVCDINAFNEIREFYDNLELEEKENQKEVVCL